MTQDDAKHALIIGGGIGGLSAACALKKIGWRVTVFERAPEISEVGAALHVWYNATNALSELGVIDEVDRRGKAVETYPIVDTKIRKLIESDYAQLDQQLGNKCYGIRRHDLISALMTGVDPEETRVNHELIDFSESDDGVVAKFSNGNEVKGDIMIAADGIKSLVRQKLFPDQPERKPLYCGYLAWRALLHFDHPVYKGQVDFLSIGSQNQFGMCSLPDNNVYWFGTYNIPEDEIASHQIDKGFIRQEFRDYGSPVPEVIDATRQENILANGIYELEPAPNWYRGRVALLGDAAHATTPNLGQGGCMAIEDAVVLARTLADNASLEQAFSHYENQRFERSAKITLASRTIGNSVQKSNRVVAGLRNLAMKWAPQNQALNNAQYMTHRVPSLT